MQKLPLFPHGYRNIGYLLLLLFLPLGIAHLGWDYNLNWLTYRSKVSSLFDFSGNNFTDELAAIGLILSLLLIAFSKEKTEDEAISFFRLEALQWAVYVNYAVLIICIVCFYGTQFFHVMTYNMFTVLIIFILRFRYILYQSNQSAA